jgi:hypothetical protein
LNRFRNRFRFSAGLFWSQRAIHETDGFQVTPLQSHLRGQLSSIDRIAKKGPSKV